MPRGKKAPKRLILPDPKYHSTTVAKFINYVMLGGKKTTAQGIVYSAMEELSQKKDGDALKLFQKVMETVRPSVEVRSRRVGGANYQVPMPVNSARGQALAFRWILAAAKARKGRSMRDRLAAEFVDILDGVGGTMKKKEDTRRMAEANKAFAHFARRR
jgi:small subunit ribosomal protein S7